MNEQRTYKNRDIVFVNTTWLTAEKCEIEDYKSYQTISGDIVPRYEVHSLENGGTFCVAEDCMFDTQEKAIAAEKARSDTQVKSYCKEIKTLEDLLKFPINHCFCGKEYTDFEALEAYKIKAKEIADVNFTD